MNKVYDLTAMLQTKDLGAYAQFLIETAMEADQLEPDCFCLVATKSGSKPHAYSSISEQSSRKELTKFIGLMTIETAKAIALLIKMGHEHE